MKIGPPLHRWNISPKQAVALQKKLAVRVRPRKLKKTVRWIAGADMAFSTDKTRCIAGIVVWDLIDQTPVEQVTATRKVTFPYVPGLLSFREAPAILAAIRKLKTDPDVFMFDGHGIAHPRRFGLACHVGVGIDRPAFGCAKSRLCGAYREPGINKGNSTDFLDGDELIGTVLRTRQGVKPVFISVGHRIRLPDAVDLALRCATNCRLPEPTRLADQLVARVSKTV
jgi:deoxyribonuclease V